VTVSFLFPFGFLILLYSPSMLLLLLHRSKEWFIYYIAG
jgi:hypothetical protein